MVETCAPVSNKQRISVTPILAVTSGHFPTALCKREPISPLRGGSVDRLISTDVSKKEFHLEGLEEAPPSSLGSPAGYDPETGTSSISAALSGISETDPRQRGFAV